MQHIARHAGFVQQLDREEARDRGLLGRLRDNRIAGGERRGDLARKDSDWKIPGRYAGDRSSSAQRQGILFASRALQPDGAREQPPCLGRIIAQIVDSFADFGLRRFECLAGLADKLRRVRLRGVAALLGVPYRCARDDRAEKRRATRHRRRSSRCR